MESVRSTNEGVGAPRAMPRLSAEGVAVLGSALEREIGAPDLTSRSELQHAVRRICIDARRSNWPPEQLLIAFKMALDTIPSVQRLTRGPDRDELVARLVSLCIDEYYAPSRR